MSTETDAPVEAIIDIEGEHIDGGAALMALNRSEIDTQIATAKKYPRSIRRFLDEATQMATLDEEIAGDCMYTLKRKDKNGKIKIIEGASARFAEIAASSWGNCRAGARVIGEDGRFVTAQGVFFDLERNVSVTYEVKRRITTSDGRTYGDDMIGVTSNAACSIAMRNAILKGIPQAFWRNIYTKARKTAIGTAQTLTAKRGEMLVYFGKMGVDESQILAFLERKGVEDIGLDELALLRGIATSIKEGETSVDDAFLVDPKPSGKVAKSSLNESLGENKTTPDEQPEPDAPTEAEIHFDQMVEKIDGLKSTTACEGLAEAIKSDDLLSADDKQKLVHRLDKRFSELAKGK